MADEIERQKVVLKALREFTGKRVKDFAYTPVLKEFVIIFEDNTALWFREGPHAKGEVEEI